VDDATIVNAAKEVWGLNGGIKLEPAKKAVQSAVMSYPKTAGAAKSGFIGIPKSGTAGAAKSGFIDIPKSVTADVTTGAITKSSQKTVGEKIGLKIPLN
jgi:hypothetical protein